MAVPVCYSFVYQGGILSAAIARFGFVTRGVSHVDCVMPDGSLAGARSDRIKPPGSNIAIEPGFRIRPDDYEHWERRDIVRLWVSKTAAKKRLAWIKHHIGDPYDTGAIIGFLLGHADHDRGAYICSAAATASAVAGGIIGKPPVPVSQITPNDLRLMLYAAGGESILSYGFKRNGR